MERNKVLGVALIQVLLITTLLALMAIHFSSTAKFQIQQALTLQDKVQAEVDLRTLKSEVLYTLLTQPKSNEFGVNIVYNAINKNWNFFGAPFSPYAGTKVKLQDLNGLISVYDGINNDKILALLQALGKSHQEAQTIVQNINRWQDHNSYNLNTAELGRDDFVIDKQELRFITGMDDKTYQKLVPLITTLPLASSNPMLSPLTVLRQYVGEKLALEIDKLRLDGSLTASYFSELTDIYVDDDITLAPGELFEIDLTSTVGSAAANSKQLYYIRPNNKLPLLIFQ